MHQDDMEEHLKRYDYVEPNEEEDKELQITLKLLKLKENHLPYNPQLADYVIRCNKLHDQEKERFPDNMSLDEYFDNAGMLYYEAVTEEYRKQMKDTTRLYNSDEYNRLLSLHNNGNKFNGFGNFNKDITIDDMEITLPTKLQTEYQERRQKFLNAILNKG